MTYSDYLRDLIVEKATVFPDIFSQVHPALNSALTLRMNNIPHGSSPCFIKNVHDDFIILQEVDSSLLKSVPLSRIILEE